MEEDYMKTRLRDAIFKEVEKYIGYVYADDYHGNDCLIVRTYDEEVSHGTRSCDEREDGYRYFDMFPLVKQSSTFTFEPNPVGIEVVVNAFYPDERISKFVEGAKAAINEFLEKHGYSDEAELSFPIDTFKVFVDCPSERETVEVGDDEYCDEDEILSCVAWESFPLSKYVRRNGAKGYTVREDNLISLAAEMLLQYDDFMQAK